jgi:tRNA(Ile)-lysidine synthetase-like protein
MPHVTIGEGRVTIGRDVFHNFHTALQRRFIYWAAQQLSSTETGHVHISAASELGLTGQVGAIALLGGGLRLRVDYQTIAIERGEAADVASNMLLLHGHPEVQVAIPGITTLSNGEWLLNASTMCEGSIDARLAIPEGSDVIVRTRKSGDRFAPLGIGGHTQKLARWMINRKIPERVRDRIPLLVVNGQIGAVLTGNQWPVSEKFAVREDSARIVYFTLQYTR